MECETTVSYQGYTIKQIIEARQGQHQSTWKSLLRDQQYHPDLAAELKSYGFTVAAVQGNTAWYTQPGMKALQKEEV